MKDYVAKFGHGTAKNAKQAQSKEKTLEKMVRSGLTEKVTEIFFLSFSQLIYKIDGFPISFTWTTFTTCVTMY